MAQTSWRTYTDETYDWQVTELTCGNTQVAFVPEQGCNIVSWIVDGVDYVVGATMRRGRPAILGIPILYPTPNRVRDASFEFDGETFEFKPNYGTMHIHGLVRQELWQVDDPVVAESSISVKASIAFEPGTRMYEQFPIANRLELIYTVTEGCIRIDWTIVNDDLAKRLPFGLAIHPYFRVIGERSQVRLLVPANKYQEVIDLMPTGRLLDLCDAPADLNEPKALSEVDLDSVYWGLAQAKPQVIYYDAVGTQVTLRADDLFKLSVIWTPEGMPFFGVENQSCSTDAHNMYAQGNTDLANLAILEPGQAMRSWIELTVSEQ